MAAEIDRAGLVGRDPELDRVRAWLELLGRGPAALLIRGEAGIGKSTLWNAAISAARGAGARVLVSRPVEAELRLGYAALGDLLGEVAEPLLGELTDPLAHALSVALSLGAEPESGDPLLVGRATLALLGRLARDGPLVIAIDDAQWLDPASARALGFAARRLHDLLVSFAVTFRDGFGEPLGLEEALGDRAVAIHLAGLGLGPMGDLLRARVDPDVPRHRLRGIHARSGGNPFFAQQLAQAPDDRLPASLDELVRNRLGVVDPMAESAIERVAVLGPSPVSAFPEVVALDAAVASGVLAEEDGRIRFAHPLLAAGAYERIPPGRRRELHRQAAAASDGDEARARHLALAAVGPDRETAQVLEDAAREVRLRGAPEAAVELAEQARRLTPPGDAEALARRTMDEADYLFVSADERGARALVDEIIDGPVRGAVRVRALVQQALTASDAATAVARLEKADAEPHEDRRLRARTLSQLAWQRGAWLGDLEPAIQEAQTALEMAEALADDATLITALTTAGLLTSVAGRPGAVDHFERALAIMERTPAAAGDHTPRLAYANERWWRGDFARAVGLMSDERQKATDRGDEAILLRLNVYGAELAMRRGRWDEAADLLEQALVDARDYWRMAALLRRAILRARRGEPGARDDAVSMHASPMSAGDPLIAAAADFATGLMALADGAVAEAATLVIRLPELSDGGGSRGAECAVYIPEAVGILVEADQVRAATALTAQLDRRRVQLGSWGDAAISLCRGLLAHATGDAATAQALLESASRGFEALGAPWEHGLALLSLGSALRRAGRRRDAATVLEQAARIFAALRAEPALRRAEEELRRARPRPRSSDRLTAAEGRVAALVAEGRTNREVAAQLFTTVATVEAHLTRIYGKAGVRSRTELARRMSDGSLSTNIDAESEQ